jgi:hypothetical protein
LGCERNSETQHGSAAKQQTKISHWREIKKLNALFSRGVQFRNRPRNVQLLQRC